MREAYRNLYDGVTLPADFQEKVFARLEPKKRRHRVLRPLGAVAAVFVVILLATPVMAAYVPEITDLMYAIAPEVAARFSPIQESCEANGIRMEVVATSVHENTVEVYLGFTDLEGQGRVTEGSYTRQTRFLTKPFLFGVRGGGYGGGASAMRYDPDSDTYYTMEDYDYHFYSKWKKRYLTIRELCGEKLTIDVDALTRIEDRGEVKVPIVLADRETMVIAHTEEGRLTVLDAPDLKFAGFGLGSNRGEDWMKEESYRVLRPGEPLQQITENLAVSGMMYLDGFLHIQTRGQKAEKNGVRMSDLWLEDSQGQRVTDAYSVSFDVEEDEKQSHYVDCYFEIPEAEVGDYTLVFSLAESYVIEGPWRVTFPLVESDYADEEQGRDTPNVRRENGYVIIEEAAVG